MTNVESTSGSVDVSRAFGATNRTQLLAKYFAEESIEELDAESAWRHVYSLLLWIDRTIGLAHCYESDKCQPGRPWYGRTLRFHRWVSGQLGVDSRNLGRVIDWLFSSAAKDLASAAGGRSMALNARALVQRAPYVDEGMPEPGEDAELEALVTETLRPDLSQPISADRLKLLVRRIQTYIGTENKRKNLVGEGFEDTLAEILRRIPTVIDRHEVKVRAALHDFPGFNHPRGGEKTRQVDLGLVRKPEMWRTLVSCKWSIRSDREEQFTTDLDTYARLESSGENFDFVLVTNEFDPARLAAACEARRGNALLFASVVHVNPEGLKHVYDDDFRSTRRDSGRDRALRHIDSGRLTSLEKWITSLTQYGRTPRP